VYLSPSTSSLRPIAALGAVLLIKSSYLIENVGLKGYILGGMSFSELHANFLVNLGEGTFEEAMELIDFAKMKVKEKFNIELELEIEVI